MLSATVTHHMIGTDTPDPELSIMIEIGYVAGGSTVKFVITTDDTVDAIAWEAIAIGGALRVRGLDESIVLERDHRGLTITLSTDRNPHNDIVVNALATAENVAVWEKMCRDCAEIVREYTKSCVDFSPYC
jgi:hypothetical protein